MSFIIPIIPVGTKPQRQPKATPPPTPQNTLYVRNLPENKKLELIKSEITKIFEPFGELIDLKIKNNIKHRGQAFISFKSLEQAQKAKDSLHGNLAIINPRIRSV
jgi:RNA recognition motif-containing protein